MSEFTVLFRLFIEVSTMKDTQRKSQRRGDGQRTLKAVER